MRGGVRTQRDCGSQPPMIRHALALPNVLQLAPVSHTHVMQPT